MGNLFARNKSKKSGQNSRNSIDRNNGRIPSSIRSRTVSSSNLPQQLAFPQQPPQFPSLPPLPPEPPPQRAQSKSSRPSFGEHNNDKNSTGEGSAAMGSKQLVAKKYALITDNFTTLEQVQMALKKEGLESSNLIVGIDFTKSNEWTDGKLFNFIIG